MAVSDTTVQRAYAIICSHEGGYTSINKDDNGAVSIGRLQWRGNRALELLKLILNNTVGSIPIGEVMFNDITYSTDWSSRTFTAAEAEEARGLLNTTTSKEQQDKLAARDISGYMSTLQSLGVTEDNALIFMADIYNQRPQAAYNIISNAQGTDIDSLYSSASVVFSGYMTRRAQVYRQLMGYDYYARPSQGAGDEYVENSLPSIDSTAEGVEFITGKLPELGGDDSMEKLAYYLSTHKTELNHIIESIYAKINSVKPYDSGKKNGWEWRRYNDGTVECWRTYDCEDVKCNTTWGSMYISADYGGLKYPFTFAKRPSVWLSLSSENRGYLLGYPNGGGATTPTSTGLWWFARGSASSVGETVRVDIFVRGRIA